MMGVQNVGLAIIPLIVAHLYGLENRYLPTVEIFFAACSLLAVVVAFALLIADKKTDKILGSPRSAIRSSKNGMVVVKNGRGRSNSDAVLYGRKGFAV